MDVRCTFLLCGTVRNEKIVILISYIIHGILLFEDMVSEFTSSYCSSSRTWYLSLCRHIALHSPAG